MSLTTTTKIPFETIKYEKCFLKEHRKRLNILRLPVSI